MLIRNIGNHVRKQDWFSVSVEIIVVVVGLFMAFQLDRWWEQRGDREQEQLYIQRLVNEVETDIEAISYAVELAEVRQGFAELLMRVGQDPVAADDKPVQFLAAVSQAAFTFTPSLVSHTFDDLRSTGNMDLIRSAEVKEALFGYYSFDEAQRQFISLNQKIEFRYFELSAGILDHEQYSLVQDNWFVVTPNDLPRLEKETVDQEAFRQAVERLRSRPETLSWLQRVHGLQRELILMNSIRLSRAEALLESLLQHSNGDTQTPR